MGIVESLCDHKDSRYKNDVLEKIVSLENKNNIVLEKIVSLENKNNDVSETLLSLSVENKNNDIQDKINNVYNKLEKENIYIKQYMHILEDEIMKLNKLENENIKKIDEIDLNVCKNNICIELLEEEMFDYKLSVKNIKNNI
jgi:hypothetical protein